jgi:hypothetical protein
MQTVMQHVAKCAGFDLPPEAADKIIDDSGGNLRKAILVLEALKMQSFVPIPSSFDKFSHSSNEQTRPLRPFDDRKTRLGDLLPQSRRPDRG